MINKLLGNIVTYFRPRRIVYCYDNRSGIFLKATEINGRKYISIAVFHDENNKASIYHIPSRNVIGIQRAKTPFQRWWYGKVLKKPLPKYPLKKLKD